MRWSIPSRSTTTTISSSASSSSSSFFLPFGEPLPPPSSSTASSPVSGSNGDGSSSSNTTTYSARRWGRSYEVMSSQPVRRARLVEAAKYNSLPSRLKVGARASLMPSVI